jgi:hypothetical protein
MGYLDVYSREYSVHNVLPFRNLTVKHDSGESGSIRIVDHLGERRGLNSLLTQHSGRQGIEAEYAKRMVRFSGADQIKFSDDIRTDWENLIGGSGGGSMSFSFWIDLENWEDDKMILDFHDKISIRTETSTGNTLLFMAYWSGGLGAWTTQADPFSVQELAHVVVTYQTLGHSSVPAIYINGNSVTTVSIATPSGLFGPMTLNYDGVLGKRSGGSDGSIDGSLGEIAIWDRVLSAQEVRDIYASGFISSLANVDQSIRTDLQLWYRLGENHDSVHKIFDRSGNGKHSLASDLDELAEIVYRDDSKPSYGKNNRNTNYRLLSGSSVNNPILLEKHDNMSISTPIPASDFQYSWIDRTLRTEYDIYSGKQNHYRYSPSNGILSSSAGYVEAIVFPSSSTIT